MGDLVLGVAKTVVEGALTKVQSVIEEEAKLRQSVQRDLVFITGEFQMMQSFLNVADEERVGNNVVRTWVRQVRDLAYDVEDCIEFVVHLDKKPAWWFRLLPPCMPAAALPLDEAVAEIKQLKARVEDVSQRNMRYNLLTDSGSKPVAQTQQPAAIAAGATAFNILGEARDTTRMQRGFGSFTDFMAMEDHTSVALRVISLWGTGGDLGKTSLIRMAYDDPKICQNFGCRAWVKLVHPFNPHEFVRSLLVQFYANSCHDQGAIVGVDVLTRMKKAAATENDLVEEFAKQVNKRYLVVLEDLSTMVEWDSIRIYLPDRQNGSRVIVSTQQFEIASLCTGHPYRVSELKQFSADHSVCVFFKEDEEGLGEEEERVSHGDRADRNLTSKKKAILRWKEQEHEAEDEEGLGEEEERVSHGDRADRNLTSKKKAILRWKEQEQEAEDEEGFGEEEERVSHGDRADRNQTSKWKENFVLSGREADVDSLKNCITFGDMVDPLASIVRTRFSREFQVITVWGVAGVGKSALVRSVYYSHMHDGVYFGRYGWADVPHPFNLRDLFRTLLLDLRSESPRSKEKAGSFGMLEDPIQECCRLIQEHQCLIVIDGLQSAEEWDLIKAALTSRPSRRGGTIIVISNDASVSTHCSKQSRLVRNVKGLNADEALGLFKQVFIEAKNTVLLSRPDMTEREKLILDELTETAKLILKKCGGLPKVIVAIAKYLADDKHLPDSVKPRTWRNLHDDLMRELETNPRLHSAWAVFTWLNSYFRTCRDSLKPCIFYLSVFPQEHSIRRRRLVRRWIADGISRDVGGLTAEGNGETFFSELVNLSIIQTPEIATMYSGTRMASCQVEGFVREYIISRPVEDNFVFALEGHCVDSQRTGRHLAIGSSWDRDRVVFDSIDFSRLRSLTVFGKWESFFVSGEMKLLRVLDLEDASGVTDDDLEQVAELLPRLKFLSLRGCRTVHRLPGSLGDLRQLQTLDVRYTSILTLPTTIVKLQKLQYLRAGAVPLDDNSAGSEDDVEERSVSSFFKFCPGRRQLCYDRRYGVKVPRGGGGGGIIGRLTTLNTLGVIDVDVEGGKAILKELKKLTQLRKLGVSGINPGNCQVLWSAISGHAHLKSLSVRLAKAGEQVCSDGEFSPPENLESLKLYYGCPVSRLPEWIKHLHNLRKLKLWRCRLESVNVHVLSELPKLNILRLCIERSETESGGGKLRFDNGFFDLKFLELAGALTRVRFGVDGCNNLKVLQLGCCEPSSVQISGLGDLDSLVQVSLKGSCDDQLKEHIQEQLDSDSDKPVIKVE